MMNRHMRGERGLRRAAREDRHDLALCAEVRAGDAFLKRGERVPHVIAEPLEAAIAGA
jgi:hypothetical protein